MDPTLFEGLFAEILAPLVNGTLSKLSDSAKAQWKKVGDKQAAEAYKAKLIKRYGTIQILGQPRPQKLGKVYTDVYLHERPTHSYAEEIGNLEEMFREQNKRFGRDERTDGLAFAKEHDRLFILGKPGAGKTTFLKYLTMQAAEGDIPLIPIFVSLNDFQHQKVDLLDYLAEQFDVCDFPEAGPFIEQLLKKGKGLILFDGLDEVSKEDKQRSTITRQLKQFITKYDRNRFAIICRIAASDYNFTGFDYVETADFTDKQVETFVRSWFAESKPKIRGFLKELNSTSNEGIKEMTTSPLLLTLLCIQFDGSMALPPSRSEIYEEALEVLLKTWDGHRDINRGDLIVTDEGHYKALTFKRKLQLMSRLAYGTFKEGKLFIKQKWLEDNIIRYIGKMPKAPDPDLVDGSLVLKAIEIQHGLLVERASRIYSFSHLTLQEYFTAKYIVDLAQTDTALSTLVSEQKITDPRWQEVFLFVAEMLPIGDELVIWFAETLQGMANKRGLKNLVAWAEKASIEVTKVERKIISKISFFACVSNIDSSSSGSTSLDIVLDHTLDQARSIDYSTDFVHDCVRSINRSIDFALDSTRRQAYRKFSHRSLRLQRYNGFSRFVKTAIVESEKIGWRNLSKALKQLPQITSRSSREEWKDVHKMLTTIKIEVFLMNCPWKADLDYLFKVLIPWLEGHVLLFDCLDRVVLEDLDREEFEAEYLYRLPPHAQLKFGDES